MNLIDELRTFPYPFTGDTYRYSNNSKPLERPCSVEITHQYEKEIALKRQLLDQHPSRCFQAYPHTIESQWEILDLIMHQLVTHYPEDFQLEKNESQWTFSNLRLDEQHSFVFGQNDTLPCEPLSFIGKHVQEDLIYMAQKDNDLYLEAGQLCFPANWSIAFNLGMNFKQIHSPIPGFKDVQLDDHIQRFLMRLEAGKPWWRKNWSLMAGDRMDTSLETFDVWGKDRGRVTEESVGDFVHLRVEVQTLFRLPRSHGILFTIHTHLLPLAKLILNEAWLRQFHAILTELPAHVADYKGISPYRDTVIAYLQRKIDEKTI